MISNKTKRYLELAKRQAFQSPFSRQRHGAVLVRGGSVINAAFNSSGFNNFGYRFNRYASRHAELGAVLGLDKSITQGSTVYVVRVNNEGDYQLSKPCKMCLEAMKFCGVKRVVYTTNSKEVIQEKL